MTRQKIAKIQLIIGIIVLIVGIVGLITSWIWLNNSNDGFMNMMAENRDKIQEDCPECSEPEIDIIVLEKANINLSTLSTLISAITSLAVLSILFILLSLLFITQGLINLPREIR